MIRIVSVLLFLFPTVSNFSQSFKNGIHLINKDDKAYTIVYSESTFPSAKICFAARPSKKMKNGIDPILYRGEIPGFKILSKKENGGSFQMETTARLEPKAYVPCLTLQLISISLLNGDTIRQVKNRTLVIENGKLTAGSK